MQPSEVKVALRREALERIASKPATPDEAQAIAARIVGLDAFRWARVVSLFIALPGEPSAESLWAAARAKNICCPAMGAKGPEFRAVDFATDMKRTERGFFEPPRGPAIDPSRIDLFIVPGLAFDLAGLRLGRGGGYYDRLLAGRRPDSTTVGLAPERFLVTELPREPHDVPMTHVATEARVLTVASVETLAKR